MEFPVVTELQIFAWPLLGLFLRWENQGPTDQGSLCFCTFGLPHWTQWQLLKVTYRSKLPRERSPKHLCLVTQSRVARTALVCPSRSFTVDPLSIKTRTAASWTKQPTSQGPRRNILSSASPEGEAAWGETQTKGRKAASLSLSLFF